eukprot:Awhi_evm1s5493
MIEISIVKISGNCEVYTNEYGESCAKSAGHPAPYLDNENCQFQMTGNIEGDIDVHAFWLESGHDFLNFENGLYSGDGHDALTDNFLGDRKAYPGEIFSFTSDGSDSEMGFDFCVNLGVKYVNTYTKYENHVCVEDSGLYQLGYKTSFDPLSCQDWCDKYSSCIAIDFKKSTNGCYYSSMCQYKPENFNIDLDIYEREKVRIESSCDDGYMNGLETGVDCGGSCPNQC